MARLLGALLAITLGLAGPARATAPGAHTDIAPPSSALDAERANLAAAFAKQQNNDASGALALLKVVVASPQFDALESAQRHYALFVLGADLIDAGEFSAAFASLKTATGMKETAGLDWHLRLRAASEVGDTRDALLSLTTIAEKWPLTLDQVRDAYVIDLNRRAGKDKTLDDPRFELQSALAKAHWTPTDATLDGDSVWLDFIRASVGRGDIQQATAASEMLVEPESIIRLRIVKAYDPVTRSNPARYDVQSAMTRQLARRKAASAADPHNLELINQVGYELLDQNRAADALNLADAVLARAKPKDGGKSDITDLSKLNWTYDNRSRALVALGRGDEAVTQLMLGARRPENGGLNVSQALNLAQLLEDQGRAAEALTQIAAVDGEAMSPYGRLDMEGVRVCALAETADQSALGVSLKFVRDHADDAPGWLQDAYICLGDLDNAARTLVTRLTDPKSRDDALFEIQDFAVPSGTPLLVRARARRLAAVRNRPEVRVAIDAFGRVESFPVIGPGR